VFVEALHFVKLPNSPRSPRKPKYGGPCCETLVEVFGDLEQFARMTNTQR
jgi:hypothetical protein